MKLGKFNLNEVYCCDCLSAMRELPDGCIDLVVTSPPYNVGKEYEGRLSEKEYTDFMTSTNNEIYRILRSGGRYCLNIPFSMKWEKRHVFLVKLIYDTLGNLQIYDQIVWNQINSTNDTAWGSFASASSPFLRHQTECILLLYKGKWHHGKGESTISNKHFVTWTIDIWSISCASRKHGHPAPYPVELPKRCIELFSFRDDLVLDPFAGSGTTLVAAKELRRRFLGFEIEQKYVDIAKERLIQEVMTRRRAF